MEDNNINQPDLQSLPKDMKFIVLMNLDAQSLGRLMQTNKSFNTLPNELNLWKNKCTTTWKLSPEKLKKIESIAATVNWHREYRILTYYSRRIYGNHLDIRPDDLAFVKAIDEDPNSLHLYSDQPVEAIAVQGKFKLFPLPKVNFGVGYYELTVEQLNEKEPTIGIGFALHRYVRAFPGWGKDSYGLHGDNGHFYNQRSFGMQRSDMWAVGDTIGFGINYAKKEIFLTRNGVLLSVIAKKVRNLNHMYATIGIRAIDNKCRVNFGQKPFEFEIEEYMKNLEQDPEFASKWPMKLYSQIIQDIENSYIDDESPEEVEEEMIGGLDYNEKPEQHDDDHHHEHDELHVHGENCKHDHGHEEEDTSELSSEEQNHRKHREYLEWLFNRLAALETDVTQQAIEENSPDIREITLRLIESLQLDNIDRDLPLADLVHQAHLEMIGFMSVQYHSYLVTEKQLRAKREAANPNANRRKLNGLDLFFEENRLVFIGDKSYPNDHPMIVAALRQLSHMHNINVPDLDNITWEDRVDTILLMAYRLYCARRFNELEEKRVQRRKENEKERKQNKNEFEKLFGKDSFVPFSSLDNLQRLIESTGQPGGNLLVSEDDLCNATEFCSMKYYGGILRNPKLPTTERVILETLNWWQCVPEVPLTPEMSLNEYRSRCVKIAEQKVAYYEDDRIRCESIVRGSIGLLRTPAILENDRLSVVILLGWIELLLGLMHQNHEISNEELSIELIKQLTARLENMDQTFQELQNAKQQARERRALEKQQQEAENNTNIINKDTNKPEKVVCTSSNNTPFIAAAAIAGVAILGAAFVFFRNKWRK